MDALPRRSFLQMGALGLGGLTLPNLLRAEAESGHRTRHKSVILIYLVGGPPHQDMFDLKPNAPKEIAGPWKPIATNVTGIQIGAGLPRLAGIMDKLVVVRSLVGNQADHDAIQVYNGHHPRKPTPSGGWPQLGSAVAKLQGSVNPSVPPFASLCYTCSHGPYNEPGTGFLGRVMTSVADSRHVEAARRFRQLHARLHKARDMIQLGAYAPGHDSELDTAVRLHPAMTGLLQQDMHECATLATSVEYLRAIVGA